MKLKLKIPESLEDITLGQFQKLSKLMLKQLPEHEFNKKKVQLFTGVSDGITQKDFIEISEQIDKALTVTTDFKPTFTIDRIEFGFIPNFDKIDTMEFMDLSLYKVVAEDDTEQVMSDKIQDYHRLMAILFRPIINKDSYGNYRIRQYNGTDLHAERMKQMPMSIVNSSIVFFWNLTKELQAHILKSMTEEQAKEQRL